MKDDVWRCLFVRMIGQIEIASMLTMLDVGRENPGTKGIGMGHDDDRMGVRLYLHGLQNVGAKAVCDTMDIILLSDIWILDGRLVVLKLVRGDIACCGAEELLT